MPITCLTLRCAAIGLWLLAGVGLWLGGAAPAAAQNPFAPVVTIDERVVTRHDVEQRARFLALFETPGDVEAEAIERLIEERLQQAEARRMGIRVSEDEIVEGMVEFAGRLDLELDDFLQAIGEAGVAPETYREFVAAGVAWREVLRRRFAGRVTVSDAELDRAQSLTALRPQLRVLLSEIVLPDTPDNRELAELLASESSIAEFAEAARLFSASESRAREGRLDWMPLASLPESVQPMLRQMRPGEVLPPILGDGAVLLLQLRGIDRTPPPGPTQTEVEYARAVLPAGTAEAELARLRADADTCPDFVALLAHLPEEAVTVESARLSEVPAAIAVELARLDEREIAANQPVPGGVQAVMLCSRRPVADLLPTPEALRDRMVDRRLGELSDGLLAELRAAAVIRQR